MAEFLCSLAGVRIGVDCVYDSTQKFCSGYCIRGEEELHISVAQNDIENERAFHNGNDGQTSHFSDEGYETLALHRKIVEALLECDILLFHGSAIEVRGQGYIFAARSGTGKTTHTRLWIQCYGDEVTVINGDKPLLRFEESGISVCGTPWNGKEHCGTNRIVPLKAVCVLERSNVNTIRRIDLSEALPYLYRQTYIPKDPEGVKKTMKLLGRLGTETILYRLGCNMDKEAAEIAYEGMVQ